MAHLGRSMPWSTGFASALLVVAADRASGAIICQPVSWDIPTSSAGLIVDMESRQALPGPSAISPWRIRLNGESGLECAVREGDWPMDGLMRCVIDPVQPGAGSLPLGLMVGPFSDFGSGAESLEDVAGQWRADAANRFGFMFVSRTGDVHYGWGQIGIGAGLVNRSIGEIAWQDTPGAGIQVGHAPAAGPLVLLGIAAIVGGPRRARLRAASPASCTF